MATTTRGAFDLAVLATSAQLLGAGERMLADSVTYVKQRKQFGREIGSYQAIKHALADVRIALDFARPLVSAPRSARSRTSAAKVAAGDAAYLAARTGLQVHGAIGYTAEFDLSIWLTKIRALVGAWGTPAFHRARDPGRAGRLMEFAFTEEQQELAATVRSLLDQARRQRRRPRRDRVGDGYDEALWQTLCEQIGVAALAIPEEYDGAGFTLFESLVVLEELGRSLAPSPLLASLVAAEALLAGADERRQAAAAPPHRRRRGRHDRARRRPGRCSPTGDRPARRRRRRPAGARPRRRVDPEAAVDGPDDPARVARRRRRHAGSATAPPRAPAPSWSARSASPRSRPAWRPGRWR